MGPTRLVALLCGTAFVSQTAGLVAPHAAPHRPTTAAPPSFGPRGFGQQHYHQRHQRHQRQRPLEASTSSSPLDVMVAALGNLVGGGGDVGFGGGGGGGGIAKKKAALLTAVAAAQGPDAGPAQEEAVRVAFKAVEKSAPAPTDLLSSDAADTLDGEWVLEYTVAAFGAPGAAASGDIDETSGVGVSSAVNASGIMVDVNAKKTTQTFDLAAGRVANTVALGKSTTLKVSGPFTPSSASGIRADVKFDNLEIELFNGSFKIEFKWLFSLVYALRPEEEAESWLDTTHLSDDLRLGRGNKGSIFVLTR